jgi:CrcB protein
MIWYVAFGSALGGVARFLVGSVVQNRAGSGFPLGTMVVNVTGAFLVGVLLRFALNTPAVTAETRAFLVTGFCGGYTTFSAFSYETARLIQDGDYRRATWYVVLSVVLSLTATFVGFAAAKAVLDARQTT